MRLRADVSLVKTDYGKILLDGRSGKYWELNPTGSLVLDELLSGKDLDAVIARLTAEFEVGPEQARSDAQALVAALVEEGLVEEGLVEEGLVDR
ncbi:Coenzyme PQQ synthesis protein D (PqqD) [Streptomyces sp. DI166]|uniref:lasso peptide biosynthesis PqqD family chaperone n=1 Tax=unclassified Streptomyces TaxID=2593676 RepID=UPI0007F53000|nr:MULTISPECIES: lasso peptide biosynthesis PqqD family chaperone [unclassified Streptomyces]SBT89777.1 Coenzyme PQQ synthesis protein D (PqqD) [Streptomyces sp. DI166]